MLHFYFLLLSQVCCILYPAKAVEGLHFIKMISFSVIHMIQKISDNDSVCWEIDDKGFGDRWPKYLKSFWPLHNIKSTFELTPNAQLSYEVLTACSFGNAITILGLYLIFQWKSLSLYNINYCNLHKIFKSNRYRWMHSLFLSKESRAERRVPRDQPPFARNQSFSNSWAGQVQSFGEKIIIQQKLWWTKCTSG